ncbi:hypothetical protein VCR17J2_100086 [Vibrio coralliirubri]|nr:hypothetical protein VCR17J2_100086 [Vibrio coralliirubri]
MNTLLKMVTNREFGLFRLGIQEHRGAYPLSPKTKKVDACASTFLISDSY